MTDDLDVALSAADAAATTVRRALGSEVVAEFKGEANPVTEVDRAAERAVRAVVADARPEDGLLGEENGGDDPHRGRVWIVDPLDGTVNFIHGLSHVAVSVALWVDGKPQVGVIIDVGRAEVFAARRGEGATMNGRPISVAGTARLDDALIVTGFPYDRRQHAGAYADTMAAVLRSCQGIRRLGSAALDFAWVAAGRFDAYYEFGLGSWDAAAGVLLVTEAGGVVMGHDGEEYRLGSGGVIAANPALVHDLRQIVWTHRPAHLP